MPVRSERELLQPSTITEVPDAPGVFELLSWSQTIFFGWADEQGIRSRLREHLSGKNGSCTKIATHFRWEEHEDPERRCQTLLDSHKEKHGSSPRCNG